MDRPSECKYCGCGDTVTNRSDSVTFACGTYWDDHNGGVWVQCHDTCGSHVGDLYRRIRRALEKIKSSKRWSVEKIAKTPLEYYVDPDGWIAQASDVDEVARILEGGCG